MRLLRSHPKLAYRDCDHCQANQYDETTGDVRMRNGKPVKRIPGSTPPCRKPKGCPKGTPEQPRTLSEKNQRTLEIYEQARACGSLPVVYLDDLIVRTNLAVIHRIDRAYDDHKDGTRQELLIHALKLRSI